MPTATSPMKGDDRRLRRREEDLRLDLAMEVLEGGYWHYDVETADFETSAHLGRFIAGPASGPLDLDAYLAAVMIEDRHLADLSPLVSGSVDRSAAEYRMARADGSVVWMRCTRRLVRNDEGQPVRVVGVAVNVTEQKRLQARVEQQAKTDALTGVGNRLGFADRADQCLARAKASRAKYQFGLLMLDLDRFKPINDRHGHLTGDGVLQVLAKRLVGTVRPIDYVARLGGDEFAVLVDDADDLSLSRLADRLVRVIAEPMDVNGQTLEVGCSIGVTRSRAADATVDAVVGRADAALYNAKRNGRRVWKLSA